MDGQTLGGMTADVSRKYFVFSLFPKWLRLKDMMSRHLELQDIINTFHGFKHPNYIICVLFNDLVLK